MPKELKQLEDLDWMPFGKYYVSRTPMQEVPASYLHYLWTHGIKVDLQMNTPQGKVARYIQKHLSHLKQEHPDGIWE